MAPTDDGMPLSPTNYKWRVKSPATTVYGAGEHTAPARSIAVSADLALKDHGRIRTLKGLPAIAAVAARQTGETCDTPRQTF